MNARGKVYLVGAGPGAIDLLTVKAFQLLQTADVVVYDRLVSSEIMEIVPDKCLKHYVGKQESEHTLPQEEINQLLVDYSNKYQKVVRLKGGDPFVFGRGGEEVELLVKNKIKFEIVPGISSSVAAATYAGIPVTHRGVSNNFTVVAGHTCTSTGFDSMDWNAFSKLGTLIILMGVRSRSQIATNLIKVGKNKNTPVAFIERATTPNQNVVISTLEEVANNPPNVSSPAVMVIGEVVNFHYDWNWFNSNDYLKEEVSVGI
ncbi:MAG: uroporphyrinogen-III C-methyltransferase [Alphaproteobacteria bacterium]|nr:MAG: uroporphyrinogen-III C-methyltransferase [Alphaproteobacteria bacterium]